MVSTFARDTLPAPSQEVNFKLDGIADGHAGDLGTVRWRALVPLPAFARPRFGRSGAYRSTDYNSPRNCRAVAVEMER